MQYRYLGNSGLVVSEMAYGNWITHAGQVAETPPSRVFTPRLTPASPPSTPLTSTRGPRPRPSWAGPWRANAGRPGDLHEGVLAHRARNDRGLSRKHIIESCHGSLRRLGVDYIDLYQAIASTTRRPGGDPAGLRRPGACRQGDVRRGLGWRGEEIEAAVEIASQMGFDRIISNQPQYKACSTGSSSPR